MQGTVSPGVVFTPNTEKINKIFSHSANTRNFMKRMDLTEILSRVALEQTDEQRQLLEQFAEGKKPVSPPVTIRFRPASREFVNQASLKLGISVSELVNVIV
jgi:hypothetical protein